MKKLTKEDIGKVWLNLGEMPEKWGDDKAFMFTVGCILTGIDGQGDPIFGDNLRFAWVYAGLANKFTEVRALTEADSGRMVRCVGEKSEPKPEWTNTAKKAFNVLFNSGLILERYDPVSDGYALDFEELFLSFRFYPHLKDKFVVLEGESSPVTTTETNKQILLLNRLEEAISVDQKIVELLKRKVELSAEIKSLQDELGYTKEVGQ